MLERMRAAGPLDGVLLDLHGAMVAMADVLIGHETYPEIDQEDRGRDCAQIMHRALQQGLRPTMALHQLPLVCGMNQITDHPPMKDAIVRLHEIEARPGVVCGSLGAPG